MPLRNNSIGRNAPTRKPKARDAAVPTVVFVLSLTGRFQTFLRFLRNYEAACLRHPELRTELLVVLFQEKPTDDLFPYFSQMKKLRERYPAAEINYIIRRGNFSRGIALNEAVHSDHVQLGDIIFFVDVDITFGRASIDRIRMNTIRSKQVYLPIVFSEYNPRGWYNESLRTTHDFDDFGSSEFTFDRLDYRSGYFRQFGYGICAIFKADVLHPDINGFNTDITGWGLEDVKFLEKIVKLNVNSTQALRSAARLSLFEHAMGPTSTAPYAPPTPLLLEIFRAPDPSLVHVYHDIICDRKLNESQYSMCLGTKANTIGDFKYVESVFVGNKSIQNFIRIKNRKR